MHATSPAKWAAALAEKPAPVAARGLEGLCPRLKPDQLTAVSIKDLLAATDESEFAGSAAAVAGAVAAAGAVVAAPAVSVAAGDGSGERLILHPWFVNLLKQRALRETLQSCLSRAESAGAGASDGAAGTAEEATPEPGGHGRGHGEDDEGEGDGEDAAAAVPPPSVASMAKRWGGTGGVSRPGGAAGGAATGSSSAGVGRRAFGGAAAGASASASGGAGVSRPRESALRPGAAASASASAGAGVCRFGAMCRTVNCRFRHPDREAATMCMFGAACTAPSCPFKHPGREVSTAAAGAGPAAAAAAAAASAPALARSLASSLSVGDPAPRREGSALTPLPRAATSAADPTPLVRVASSAPNPTPPVPQLQTAATVDPALLALSVQEPETPSVVAAGSAPTPSAAGVSTPGGGVSVASLSWADLEPLSGPDARARVGGFGVVFPAMWRRRRIQVAVKFFKLSALSHGAGGGSGGSSGGYPGSPGGSTGSSGSSSAVEEAARLLEREASALLLAQHDGANEHVLRVFGIARGPAPHWLATLGDFVSQCGSFISSSGSAAGAVAPSPSPPSPPSPPSSPSSSLEFIALVTAWEAGGSLQALMYPAAAGPGDSEPPAVAWPRTTRDKVRLLRDIAIGLWHLHCNDAACIIHGDLKPANVLLSANPHTPGASPSARLADFGFVELRRAAAAGAAGLSSVRTAVDERGTWPYMCPSLSKFRTTPAAAPSRSSDMYAFGTLAWEVLAGKIPWDGHDAVSRLVALRTGEEALDMGALPGDTPPAVVQLVSDCLRLDRAGRATVDDARAVLERSAVELDSGHFHCFLSHAWGAPPSHDGHAAAMALASVLCSHGLRVWVDEREMGHDLAASMRAGVANSDACVVVLTRPYASSGPCMFELRTAVELGKPIVTVLLEPGRWQDWVPQPDAPNGDLAQLAGLSVGTMKMYVDLRDSGAAGVAPGAAGGAAGGAGAAPAAGAGAGAGADSTPGGRLRAFFATPAGRAQLEMLMKLVRETCVTVSRSASSGSSAVAAGAAGATGTGSTGGSTASAPSVGLEGASSP